MQVHLTKKSTNRKTGPIPVSTTSEDTCPRSCPWFGKGCYANNGPLRIHWRKVSDEDRGSGFTSFLIEIRKLPEGQLWRHNQAGDLPGHNERINRKELLRLSTASNGRRGFTYTHKPVLGGSTTAKRNRVVVAEANTPGFTINLSGDGLEHADMLADLKIAPVTTILPSNFEGKRFVTQAGRKGIVCPATYRDTSCADCALCAIHDREYIIGFPAHGSQKSTVDNHLRDSNLHMPKRM